MAKMLRRISAVCFISALAGIVTLLIGDGCSHLRLTGLHQRAGALSLMLIGASYISLQLSAKQRSGETLKGILLGVAFLLWGSESFLPPSRWVTAMDSLVVVIFVVDLSLIIVGHLKGKDREAP
jgi:hypothetical protein